MSNNLIFYLLKIIPRATKDQKPLLLPLNLNIMEITLQPVHYQKKHILWNLLELYCYDFSPYIDTDVNDSGRFGYRYLDHYWTEKDRHPFLILFQEKIIGFVLVNQHFRLTENKGCHSIAEFFYPEKIPKKGIRQACSLRRIQ